jgi:hypothetical protein
VLLIKAWVPDDRPELRKDGGDVLVQPATRHISDFTVDVEISVYSHIYDLVGTVMHHASPPPHSWPIVLYQGKLWGPQPSDQLKDSQAPTTYTHIGEPPYVTRVGPTYPTLHCYVRREQKPVKNSKVKPKLGSKHKPFGVE